MATVVETLLIDDLDGGRAERTVRFALDGQEYEIELAPGNIALLEDKLAKYIAAARTVKPGKGKPGKRKVTAGRVVIIPQPAAPTFTNDEVRRWAQENRGDLEVKDRGRVSAEAIAAYKSAHGIT